MSFKTRVKEDLAALNEKIEQINSATNNGFAGVGDVFDVIFDKLGYDTTTCAPSLDVLQQRIASGYELVYHNDRAMLLIRKRNVTKKTK